MTHPEIPDTLPEWIVRHLTQYYAEPEKGHLWDATKLGGHPDTPCLVLTTVGRRSGRTLPMPLIYGKAGDEYVIVASKGGAPAHPGWYHNLVAEPKVDLQVAADRFEATARVTAGDERSALWSMMADIYPPYIDYQAKTGREIPVVALARAG